MITVSAGDRRRQDSPLCDRHLPRHVRAVNHRLNGKPPRLYLRSNRTDTTTMLRMCILSIHTRVCACVCVSVCMYVRDMCMMCKCVYNVCVCVYVWCLVRVSLPAPYGNECVFYVKCCFPIGQPDLYKSTNLYDFLKYFETNFGMFEFKKKNKKKRNNT